MKIKIIARETKRSFGLDLINGDIAAIAVAPHIAVPEAINIPNFLSNLNTLEIKIPRQNIETTKIEI